MSDDGSEDRERLSLELPRLRLRRPRRRTAVADPAPAGGGSGSVSLDQSEPEPPPIEIDAAEPAPRQPRGPGGMPAAVVTGLLVGLGLVGLTWASLQGCERVQGTSSCGQAGYPLLGLILVVTVVFGMLLLRVARVPEAGATSVLGVGAAAVLTLLLLIDHLTDPAMLVVIPVLCAATYAGAHGLTRSYR